MAKQVRAKKPKELAMDMRLAVGDVIAIWDTETDSKNPYEAQAVDIDIQFIEVRGPAAAPTLVKHPHLEYQSLIKPEKPMSAASIAWHKDKGKYSNEMLENESNLRTVADEAVAAVLAASNAVGQLAGERRVFMMGMNSNSYDMRLMQFGTERITGANWSGMLGEAGCCGVVDLMSLVKKPRIEAMPLLKAARVNGNSSQGKIYEALFKEELPDAHVAKADVNGIVRIVTESDEVKNVLLSENAGSSLGAWKIHHDALQSRLEFKKEMERKWREEDLPVVPAPIAATAAPAAASVATTGPVEVATQAEDATSTTSGPRRSERGRKKERENS